MRILDTESCTIASGSEFIAQIRKNYARTAVITQALFTFGRVIKSLRGLNKRPWTIDYTKSPKLIDLKKLIRFINFK